MNSASNATASGWFSTNSILAAATLAALQVGTGGLPTEQYYKSRGEKGYAFARYQVPEKDQSAIERTPAEELSRIRDAFRVSVTDMALLFGVSRQAIYDWQSGKAIGSDNLVRLHELARAGDIVRAANVQNPAYLLKRKITEGMTFIELVKAGRNAETAALDLIEMIRREDQQRARLNARLGDRTDQMLRAAPLAAPMLNEEG